ncbi:MAG: sortase [Clostridia bacterium]
MFESKYSKVLTVILVIVIIAILGLLGFLGYDWYKKYFLENDAMAFVDNYTEDSTEDKNNTTDDSNATNPIDSIDKSNTTNGAGSNTKPQYKGFDVVGTIEIPKTKANYPILEKVSKSSLETSVAMLYGAGINQVGNTVIIGHNYRNGAFFSNNKKLEIGDKIYVTDNSKNKLTYTIYQKFETTPEDASFYSRDTAGKPEITLSTCNDDSSKRLIIFAKTE